MQIDIRAEGSKTEALAAVTAGLRDAAQPAEAKDGVDVLRALRDLVSLRLTGANDSDQVSVVVQVDIAVGLAPVAIPPEVAAPKVVPPTPDEPVADGA